MKAANRAEEPELTRLSPSGTTTDSKPFFFAPLLARRSAVANDLNADGKALVMITAASQGGKSTFIRSVGLAQLTM